MNKSLDKEFVIYSECSECGLRVYFDRDYREDSCCDRTKKAIYGINWKERFLAKDRECSEMAKEIWELKQQLKELED